MAGAVRATAEALAAPAAALRPRAAAAAASRSAAAVRPALRPRQRFARGASTAAHAGVAEMASVPSLGPPFDAIRADLLSVATHISSVVRRTDCARLEQGAGYLLRKPGKMLRPALCALAGYATLPVDDARCRSLHGGLSRDELLETAARGRDMEDPSAPFVRHLRLGEVIELIHTGSLAHDDILDDADTRRGRPALHIASGVVTAVQSGDFLLSRACGLLNTLGSPAVTLTVARALEDLVIGEVMQMEGVTNMEGYLRKCFCKASSLIAHGCRAAAMLSDPDNVAYHNALWLYGKHLGIAFQVVDDILDYTSSGEELGKPALADLRCGLATMPVLLAAEQQPLMQELIERRFSREGDPEQALHWVHETGAIAASREAAKREADLAIEAIKSLPANDQKDALVYVTQMVLTRKS
eukprot:TRINITY_DN52011_c0_g1_i1.p1 TRINITY_DN52011_c0_g1~~TRINITY_DN52011_c0_g1_i1.p1  ORF type:complete len:444 (+),score=117.89 TRINITY_DN52011_c0_g1_i1:92-1333(+)